MEHMAAEFLTDPILSLKVRVSKTPGSRLWLRVFGPPGSAPSQLILPSDQCKAGKYQEQSHSLLKTILSLFTVPICAPVNFFHVFLDLL